MAARPLRDCKEQISKIVTYPTNNKINDKEIKKRLFTHRTTSPHKPLINEPDTDRITSQVDLQNPVENYRERNPYSINNRDSITDSPTFGSRSSSSPSSPSSRRALTEEK